MEIEKITPHYVANQNTKPLKQRSQTPNKLSQLNKAYPSYMEIEKIAPHGVNIQKKVSQIKNNTGGGYRTRSYSPKKEIQERQQRIFN